MRYQALILSVLLIGTAVNISAQDKDLTKAIKNYDKYSFDTAAEEIEDLSRKTPEMKRKLAESYFNTQQFAQAERVYTDLTESTTVKAADLRNYAEVLLINKKYAMASQVMEAFYELSPSDSRGIAFHKSNTYHLDLLKDQGQFTVKNLDINTAQEDFGTSYYKDQVVFASSREGMKPIKRKWNWNRLPFLDMYVASANDENLGVPSLFRKSVNKKYHEGPTAFDEKGEFMMFTRNNYEGTDEQGVRKLKMFESSKTDKGWSSIKAFPYNSDEYSVGHATLSPDGKTMYFASDMPGGIGGVDIYRSTRDASGSWSTPTNLGPGVNTEGNEMFPFYHSEGLLFFASNGLPGLGGLDVFATPIDDMGKAGAIKNLGTPINSNRDDFALILNKEMKSGFLSSNREDGKGDDDIYSFKMLKPLSFGKRIEGIAMDKVGNILPEAIVELRDAQGTLVQTVTTGEDGAYAFTAEPDMDYQLGASLNNYFDGMTKANTRGDEDIVKADLVLEKDPGFSLYGLVTETGTAKPIDGVKVTLMDNSAGGSTEYMTTSSGDFRRPLTDKRINDRVNYNLKLEREGYLTKTVTYRKQLDRPGQYDIHEDLSLDMTKLEVGMDIGKAIDINPIYFDVNKYNIRPDAAAELQKIVNVMNEYPSMIIELGSHTDCRASEAYNLSLSDKRAKASAAWVKSRISDGSRIYGKGYGETQLVNHCACGRTDKDNAICSEEEHQLNRRTEFRIVKM